MTDFDGIVLFFDGSAQMYPPVKKHENCSDPISVDPISPLLRYDGKSNFEHGFIAGLTSKVIMANGVIRRQ